jgi:hypothetical protein
VSSVSEERLRFVGRLLDGETMTDVCRDFGVSPKPGYFDLEQETLHPWTTGSAHGFHPCLFHPRLRCMS